MTASQALVLAGHGSHYNSDSARPTFDHADAIRASGAFAEVREAFWKEEPSLREVLRTVESREVFVVPAFVSEGYFVTEVLPRELGLASSEANESGAEEPGNVFGTYENVGEENKIIRYTEPFGTHDAMTEVVVQRAREAARGLAGESIVAGESIADGSVGLAVVGHGTERNPHSAEAIRYHAERIRERDEFGEVRALFMDESPYVEDATDHFGTDEVVAVPLFVADGFHTREEIPELLGLEPDEAGEYRSPTTVGNHRIWYAGAVGTHPGVADVILERAQDAGARTAIDATTKDATEQETASQAFLAWLESDDGSEPVVRTWGELAITTTVAVSDGRRYELRHRADCSRRDGVELKSLADPSAVRDHVRFDDEGEYRPLMSAPTLPTGWVCTDLDATDLVRAVEFVYPASIANWHLEREGRLDVSHFRETAERQTGIYEIVTEMGSDELAWATQACCADGACVKRRAWDESDDEAISVERGEGATPCREPCSLFVAAARAFIREERGAEDEQAATVGSDVPDPDVRVGNVGHEANPYRVRFRRARDRAEDEQAARATAGGEP